MLEEMMELSNTGNLVYGFKECYFWLQTSKGLIIVGKLA